MNVLLKKINSFHLNHFVPLLAIPAAILMPKIGSLITPFTSWILAALLFLAFLGLEPKKLLRELKRPQEPIYLSIVILIISPLVILPIMERFFPDYRLGALIFMLMPAAVSSPAVARLYGGNIAVAAINTIFSNLLSPFSITLLLALFAATTVEVSLIKVLLKLLILIVIPFLLSLIAHHYAEKSIEKAKQNYTPLALGLLFIFFFAAIAPYRDALIDNFGNQQLWLAVLVTHLLLFFFAKLMVNHLENLPHRIAIESNLIFLNVGLAVILAQNYFGPTEMLFIVYCQIFWVILVGLFKYFR